MPLTLAGKSTLGIPAEAFQALLLKMSFITGRPGLPMKPSERITVRRRSACLPACHLHAHTQPLCSAIAPVPPAHSPTHKKSRACEKRMSGSRASPVLWMLPGNNCSRGIGGRGLWYCSVTFIFLKCFYSAFPVPIGKFKDLWVFLQFFFKNQPLIK